MIFKSAGRTAGYGAILAALTAMAGCDRVGNPLEALGASIPPPDEFQVIASKPLQMPASASLPEPRPGAASPLEPDPHRDARDALLGNGGSAVTEATPSAGEQVLLASANASSASSDIRVQLDQERQSKASSKEYEPPSVIELLGGTDKPADQPDLLDPQVEAERLQRLGTAAPVDPNAELPADSESDNLAGNKEISEYPPGRPQAPFTKDTTIINN